MNTTVNPSEEPANRISCHASEPRVGKNSPVVIPVEKRNRAVTEDEEDGIEELGELGKVDNHEPEETNTMPTGTTGVTDEILETLVVGDKAEG